MKYFKTLRLAAVSVVALMAFVGASTASATVLCKEPGVGGGANPTGTVCPAGQAYGGGTRVHAVNEGVVKLTTEYVTIECNRSTVEGSTDNEGSNTETVTGSISTLTFEECNCEVKVLKAGKLEVHWISGTHNGTLTGSGSEVTEVTTTCSVPLIGKIHCIYYTNNTDLGTVTGGNPATADISADVPRLTTSGFCDKTADFEASYTVTTPAPLYITGHT